MNQATAPAPAPGKPASTLLCVDDEPNILSSLRRLFRAHGYRVLVAERGAAALQVLESEAVDLVISDMRMPEMDGAQFLQQVRERWPETVRLLLTGHADVASIIDAINRGEIYRYITKPWDDNDIVLLVRHALERKELDREKQRLEALTLRQNEELRSLNASLDRQVAARTADLAAANALLKTSYFTTLKVFSTLIEMRGAHLAGHARRVAELARRIARQMGLQESQTQEVFVVALLHEIGKLGFSDELLAMPATSMAGKHINDYRQHPVRAEQLLMPLPDLRGVAASIGAQLERFDGSGFPNRLFERAIPLGARILSLASDYDNLQIGALAQSRLGADDARALVVRGSGSKYDPEVVAAFSTVLASDATANATRQVGTAMSVRELLPGMVLARDLIGPGGLLMLAAEHVMDQRLIERIQDFEKSREIELVVHVWSSRNPPTSVPPSHSM